MNQQKSTLLPIILTVLISAIIFGGLGYYLARRTPTPTTSNRAGASPTSAVSTATNAIETKDWKTYTNTKYGYTVSYPGTWQINEGSGTVSFVEPYEAAANPIDSPLHGNIQVAVRQGDAKHNYADWSYDRFFNYMNTGGKSEGEEFEPVPVNASKKETVKIDGIDAVLVEYTIDVSGLYGAFFKHGNDMYDVSLGARGDYQSAMISKYGPTLKKMLPTFKFTKGVTPNLVVSPSE